MEKTIFVIDTNIFSIALMNLPIDIFTDIYEPWSIGMKNEYIISVDEVFNELMKLWSKDNRKNTIEAKWITEHKSAFKKMSNEESKIL
jgi:hypothetical protein